VRWTRRQTVRALLSPVEAGRPGIEAFDAGQVMGPEVLYEAGQWRMWYTGMSRDRHESGFGYYRIGLATSADGREWSRAAEGRPVVDIGPARACDSVQSATPCVLREADGYRMWYAAWSPEFNHTLAAARSADGLQWVRENGGRPLTGLDPPLAFGPSVCRIGGRYLLLYMALQASRGLYAAVSSDGCAWEMANAGQPVLEPGDADAFDGAIVGHPSLLADGPRLRVWYTGYRRDPRGPVGLKLSIGLAEGTWHRPG
jgi:hypothetical protein